MATLPTPIVRQEALEKDAVVRGRARSQRLDTQATKRGEGASTPAVRTLLQQIVRPLAETATVRVLLVPGNHDRQSTMHLGVVLQAHYRNDERVTVDAGPNMRKYVRHGSNLIGFTHGCDEKHTDLALIMANERKDDWASTRHRAWHLVHYHKRKETRHTSGDTHGGVAVEIIPSLSGTDAWHYRRGYVGNVPAAHGYLWSAERGLLSTHKAYASEDAYQKEAV